MSTTSTGSAVAGDPAQRSDEGQPASSLTADHLGQRRRAAARTPAKNSSRFDTSRLAEVATNRMRSGGTPASATWRRSLETPRTSAQRVGGERPGRINPLAEPDDLGLASDLGPAAVLGGAAISSRSELVPQSIAATGAPSVIGWCSLRSFARHGDGARTLPRGSRVSSPSGLTPGPAASAWASSACRHFTRSGIPPALTPAISATSTQRGAVGEIALVRGAVGAGQLGIGGQSAASRPSRPGLEASSRRRWPAGR